MGFAQWKFVLPDFLFSISIASEQTLSKPSRINQSGFAPHLAFFSHLDRSRPPYTTLMSRLPRRSKISRFVSASYVYIAPLFLFSSQILATKGIDSRCETFPSGPLALETTAVSEI